MPTIFHQIHILEVGKMKVIHLDAKYLTADKKRMEKYLPRRRGCYFEGERKLKFFSSYTKTLCEYECLTNYTLNQCGCVKFSMPRTNKTQICEYSKFTCLTNAYNDLNVTLCNCLQPCTDIEYFVTFEKTTDFASSDPRGNAKAVESNAKETALEFKVASHQITKIRKSATYGVQDFIADCGGLSGFFLGFSMLSVGKFIQKLITAWFDCEEEPQVNVDEDLKPENCKSDDKVEIGSVSSFQTDLRDVLTEIQMDLEIVEDIL